MKAALSEIEGCVLGLIDESGPATPYAIRRDFLDSPTPQWSGSAGTIYPLVTRLQRLGLVRSTVHRTGKRSGRHFSLTAAGRRAFRRWLTVPLPDMVAGIPPDPLRSRIRFLGSLPKRRRHAFVAEALRALNRQARVLEDDWARQHELGPFHGLMSRGALLTMQARVAFLEEAAKALART